jgi:hypothetical protein
MLLSPRTVGAACVYASIYALGVLFTDRLASLFLMLFSPRGVSAACIYALTIYLRDGTLLKPSLTLFVMLCCVQAQPCGWISWTYRATIGGYLYNSLQLNIPLNNSK